MNSVSIAENTFNSQLNIYPNPTEGKVFIELGQTQSSVTAIVRNALGQEINRELFTGSQQFELEIKGESGLYFIELIGQDDRRAVMQILKE